jgi:quercetin dioxygenase-like cupin family protein
MKNTIAKILSLCVLLIFTGCATCHIATSQKPDIAVNVLAKTVSSWDGNLLPFYPEGQPEITILRIRVEPGVSLAMHKHPVINAGVLIEGQLTVMAEDGAILRLKAGDGIVELVDKWHYGRNDGEIPAEIIVFYVGTKDGPITVHQDTIKKNPV